MWVPLLFAEDEQITFPINQKRLPLFGTHYHHLQKQKNTNYKHQWPLWKNKFTASPCSVHCHHHYTIPFAFIVNLLVLLPTGIYSLVMMQSASYCCCLPFVIFDSCLLSPFQKDENKKIIASNLLTPLPSFKLDSLLDHWYIYSSH